MQRPDVPWWRIALEAAAAGALVALVFEYAGVGGWLDRKTGSALGGALPWVLLALLWIAIAVGAYRQHGKSSSEP